MKSLTFSIYEIEVLDTLEEELILLKEMLREHTVQDEGPVIENPSREKTFVGRLKHQKKLPTTIQQPNNILSFSNLPKPKSKKGILSGRVGVAAERKRSSQAIKIPSSLPTKKEPTVVQENIDLICPATYDIPIDEHIIITNESNDDLSEEKLSDEDIVITKALDGNEIGVSQKKKRKLVLSNEAKAAILGNDMLTDESINLFQQLRQKTFSTH